MANLVVKKWFRFSALALASALVAGTVIAVRLAASDDEIENVGKELAFKVSADRAQTIKIPTVGEIHAQKGAFSESGVMTVQRVKTELDQKGVTPAGVGIDVQFQSTRLTRDLRLTFKASPRPTDAIPVMLHLDNKDEWDIRQAEVDGEHISAKTSKFSLQLPGWLNPGQLVDSIKQRLASGIGGRTSALNCGGVPDWFVLNSVHSSLVHVCAKENRTSDGQQVAEIQLKSNRGASIEVNVPGDPEYVWVEGQSWETRKTLGSKWGFNPNAKVILPAGKTMTVGYTRPAAGQSERFWVSGSNLALLDSMTRAITDFAWGESAGLIGDNVQLGWMAFDCLTGLSVGAFDQDMGLSNLQSALGCIASSATSGLDDPRAAAALQKLGIAVKVWPFLQIGVGGLIDKLAELGSGGDSVVAYTTIGQPKSSSSGSGGSPKGDGSGIDGVAPPPASNPPSSEPKPRAWDLIAVVYGDGHVGVAFNVGWEAGRDPVTCHFFQDGVEVFTAQCGTRSSKQFYGVPPGVHSYYATVSDRYGVYSDPSNTVTKSTS